MTILLRIIIIKYQINIKIIDHYGNISRYILLYISPELKADKEVVRASNEALASVDVSALRKSCC
jgi:hypothetical protein